MNKKIQRNYLEINSLKDFKDTNASPEGCLVNLLHPADFQLNKFFYKNIGKKHHWLDRLLWTEKQWIDYTSNKKVKTFVLKKDKDLTGYFELVLHQDKNENEIEIAYLGLLEEYRNQKLGSYLLSSAIRKSFLEEPRRVWVHTCSLDHENALKNYISRGMTVFKKEIINI